MVDYEKKCSHGLMMKIFIIAGLLSTFLWGVSYKVLGPQHILVNPDRSTHHQGIPTVHESAVQAQRILRLSSFAIFSTVFPSTNHIQPHILENRPDDIGGVSIALVEYYASCAPSPENPIIIGVSISTMIENARAGSNVTMSLRYHPPSNHPPSNDTYTYAPANLPRFSLMGYIEPLPDDEVNDYDIKSCFLEKHPEAVGWTPGNAIHESWWGRLVVEQIYWVGGFGNQAYIGWIPVEVYRAVTEAEVEDARLVGEEGWMEWRQLKYKQDKNLSRTKDESSLMS